MPGRQIDRNSVFYRFASDAAVDKIEFTGNDIAVGDLKQAIAEKRALTKFDLVLVNESTNEVYSKDGFMLHRNMSLIVKRTPPQSRKNATGVTLDYEDVWKRMPKDGAPVKAEDIVEKVPIQQRACPPEYLCPLCGDIFDDPSIARCCGRSGCSRCFAPYLDTCPLCSKMWDDDTMPVANPRLAATVMSLDLDYFILPNKFKAEPVDDGSSRKAAPLPGGWLPPPSPGLPPPSPGLPPPSPGVPPPSPGWPGGVTMRPCMLSPEQFFAWQQSLKNSDAGSSSGSDGGRRKRKRSRERRVKKKRSRADLSSADSGGHHGSRKEKKRRR